MPGTPRTDPYEKDYFIRLLPRVVHAKPLIGYTYPVKSVQCFPLSLRTGRRRLVKISPWSPAFPPEPPLRVRIPRIVRLLLRYYADVRLLNDVRVRIAATAFPYRPAYRATAGVVELSRFSSIECPRMHRVLDSAGPNYG